MADNRLDRTEETRDKKARTPVWKRPELLPSPKPQDGWTFHWVRVSMLGDLDAANVSSKIREGWEPCLAKDHKEIFVIDGESERFKDNIVIGGLMLCKAPAELMSQRKAHYEHETSAQMEAVNNSLMKESDPRMPLFTEGKQDVSFGKGT